MKETIRKLDSRPEGPESEVVTLNRPPRLVVAALILRPAAVVLPAGNHDAVEVLICQRKADQPMSLKWEFPGGKIEAGETSEEALARELEEELGISATIGRKVARIKHKYRNGGMIDLQFFVVDQFTGPLENRIFNDVRWSPLASLPGYDFLTADLGLIRDLSEGRLL